MVDYQKKCKWEIQEQATSTVTTLTHVYSLIKSLIVTQLRFEITNFKFLHAKRDVVKAMSEVYEELTTAAGDGSGRSWSAKFPAVLANKIIYWKEKLGFPTVGEFLRHCVRKEIIYNDVRTSEKVMNWLVRHNRISVDDLSDAVRAVAKDDD